MAILEGADPHAWDWLNGIDWTQPVYTQLDDGPWVELAKPRPPYIGRHRGAAS